MEIWKSIPGYEEWYEASNYGRVKRLAHWCHGNRKWWIDSHLLKANLHSPQGYQEVGLRKDGKTKVFDVHVLIAMTFLSARPKGMEIHHKNGNKFDNHSTNLEYIHHIDNMKEAKERHVFGRYGPRKEAEKHKRKTIYLLKVEREQLHVCSNCGNTTRHFPRPHICEACYLYERRYGQTRPAIKGRLPKSDWWSRKKSRPSPGR